MHVVWEIELDAVDPRSAALKARAIQRNPESTATVLDVTSEDGQTVRVDLDEEEVPDGQVR